MKITEENKNEKFSANFCNNEFMPIFFGEKYIYPVELSDVTCNAIQFIREYYSQPLRITSTKRYKTDHSQHNLGKAIDAQWISNNVQMIKLYNKDILNKTGIFTPLISKGITGFGIYNEWFHIDSRTETFTNEIEINGKVYKYSFWDYRKNEK